MALERQSRGRCNRLMKVQLQLAAIGAGATLLAGAMGERSARADDIATIKSRIVGQLQGSIPSTNTVTSLINSMAANGSWSDVTYTSQAQTNWSPLTHVQRLEQLADYYSTHTGNTTVQAALIKGFDYWFVAINGTTNPTSSNWFDNDIAGPQQVGDVLVLAQPLFSTGELNLGLNYLNNANGNITSNVGQNIVDESIVEIDEAIVNNSSTGMQNAFNEIGITTNIVGTGGSGIRQDKAYQFHGPQLYIGGYGHSYISDVLNIATLSAGTAYALTTTQQHLLVDSLLDGSQWFIRGDGLDMFADGRQVTYTSFINSGTSFEGAIQDALATGTYRQTELQAFLARQQATDNNGGKATSTAPLIGNRYFFSSEAMVNQRVAWYGSVKVTSTRTSQPEEGNAQGLENQFLGDGVNEIMITGNEYSNIQAAWNWYRLPGTTVEQNGNSLTIGGVRGTGLAQLDPENDSGGGSFGGTHGTTAYAGGASDGMYGVTGFDYSNRFDVKAKKAYFFFDNEEVALGNSITSTSATAEVDTTLNQCLMTDASVKYEVSGNATVQSLTLGAAAITPANLKWVYQGGVGYIFLTPVSNATIMAQSQTGNWANLNTANSGNVTQNVFTLYINHGMAVSGGTYSYIEVPMTSSAGMDAYIAANPIVVLQNNVTAEAVRQTSLDLTQAAFYSAGSITLDTGGTIGVNNPAAVMFDRGTNTFKVTAGSPTASALAINVTLTGVTMSGNSFFGNFGTGVVNFNTPGGNFAGSSVGLSVTTNGGIDPTITLASMDLFTASSYTMGNIALTGNTTIQTNDTFASMVFSGNVSGVGFALNKAGVGTMTLSGNSTFTGGMNVNNGTVRVTNAGGLGAGNTTVNPSGVLVVGANVTAPIFMAGGTMNFAGSPTLVGNVTAVAGTSSFIQTDDPLAPTTSINVPFTGLLLGSGNITILSSSNENSPDGAQALRINTGNGSTFSGNLTLGHNVKGELFGNNAGITTPLGTGTIILTAGDATLGGNVTAIGNTTGYSELNLRNNTAGNQTYGNNVVITGTGLALINTIGTAAAGLGVTMGNLQIGNNQELGIYLAATFPTHPLYFNSVTLNGGTARLSPKTNGFGAPTSNGGDMYLGNISELVPGSGISMTGLKTLFLNGYSNTFTGGVSAVSGALVFQPNPMTGASVSNVGPITGAAPITISADATVVTDSLNVSNLTLNGAAQIRPGAGNAGTSAIGALTMGGGSGDWTGSLDITNNHLILESTASHGTLVTSTMDQVAFGTAQSGGIFSSTLSGDQRVVVIDNAVAGFSSVGGVQVDGGSVIVGSAVPGDIDLSGTVDILDLQDLANHWQQNIGSWGVGDFDGNGIVDILDLQALANHWEGGGGGGGGGQSFNSALLAAFLNRGENVPEPGSLAVMGLGGLLMMRRRQRG